MPAFIDRTGQRFGRLTVISVFSKASRVGFVQTKWTCQCDCGNICHVSTNKLANGHTQSCGCYMKERASEANIKHGQTSYPNGGSATKEYNTWMLMVRRCHKVTSQDYPDYGARGIFVCDRWHNFVNFYSDMGKAPSARHSIDRIDNNGPYSPENCKWSTPVEQRRNRRDTVLISCRGKTMTPAEWAIETGVNNKRIYARIKRGWTVEKALFTPV